MSTNFSFKRLLLLIQKQWVENRRLYFMSVLALVGLLGIVFALWFANSGNYINEKTIYVFGMVGLFIMGAIFASTTFSMLGYKDKGIYWISFPASHLEKFLVSLFYNLIIFTLVYAVAFFCLKSLFEIYFQFLRENGTKNFNYDQVDWTSSEEFHKAMPIFGVFFFTVQSLYMLGSVTFKRFSFIATTIVLAILLFGYIYFSSQIAKTNFDKGFNFTLFNLRSYNIDGDGTYREYIVSPFLKTMTVFFIYNLLPPILWFITWVKLKEKEI